MHVYNIFTEESMLIALAFMIVGGFVGSFFGDEKGAGPFIGGLVGILGGFMVAYGLGEHFKNIETISANHLGSLRNSSSLTGTFFLGCGTIGTKPYYVYFEEVEEDGYVYRRLRADYCNAVVYEEDITYGVVEYCKVRPPAWMRIGLVFWEGQELYNFRIPKGSIKKEFAL